MMSQKRLSKAAAYQATRSKYFIVRCHELTQLTVLRLGRAVTKPTARYVNVTYPYGENPVATYIFQYRTRSKSPGFVSERQFLNTTQETSKLKGSSSVRLPRSLSSTATLTILHPTNSASRTVFYAKIGLQ